MNTDTDYNAAADAYEKLNPDEVHELRKIIEQTKGNTSQPYALPILPITELDKDKFADSLVSGKAYSEVFERFSGKLKVTLRSQLKWEEDAIIEQVYKDFEDKVIKNQGQYANRLNIYKLCYQVQNLDGANQVTPHKNVNLREFAEKSIFESMTEPKLYILISLLTQFDAKVTTLCRSALPDFLNPDADS